MPIILPHPARCNERISTTGSVQVGSPDQKLAGNGGEVLDASLPGLRMAREPQLLLCNAITFDMAAVLFLE